MVNDQGAKKHAAVSKDKPKSGGTIFQLKITLNNVKPPIWRRVQTKDCTLDALNEIIQVSMGWHGGHLHVFEINREQLGAPEQWEEGDEEISNSRKVKLSQLGAVKKFKYIYDMGDNWEHIVEIEQTLPAEPGVKYPCCIDGKRACPPEDCGGAWGYGDFLEAVQNPKHQEHDEMLEWVGGEFDPETFDLNAVNKEL